jgi:hypothetical protein
VLELNKKASVTHQAVQFAFGVSWVGKERINSRITSVAGRPVIEQYFSNLSASPDARLIVSRLVAHFLFTDLINSN